jgi:hypothetical protein
MKLALLARDEGTEKTFTLVRIQKGVLIKGAAACSGKGRK